VGNPKVTVNRVGGTYSTTLPLHLPESAAKGEYQVITKIATAGGQRSEDDVIPGGVTAPPHLKIDKNYGTRIKILYFCPSWRVNYKFRSLSASFYFSAAVCVAAENGRSSMPGCWSI
jgi:hypothetical protein